MGDGVGMLASSIRILVRRWRLMIVALMVGLWAGAGTAWLLPPQQQSSAAVLFVPALKQPGVDGPTNPLLALTGSVGVVASVVQIAVTDDKTQLQLVAAGHTAPYQVVPNLGENAGPILLVSAQSSNAAAAQGTRDAVVATISDTLRALQDARGVPPDLRVNAVVLTSDPTVKTSHKVQIQMGVAVTGATVVLLWLLIIAQERRALRSQPSHGVVRARRRARGTIRRQGGAPSVQDPVEDTYSSGDSNSAEEPSDAPESRDSEEAAESGPALVSGASGQ